MGINISEILSYALLFANCMYAIWLYNKPSTIDKDPHRFRRRYFIWQRQIALFFGITSVLLFTFVYLPFLNDNIPIIRSNVFLKSIVLHQLSLTGMMIAYLYLDGMNYLFEQQMKMKWIWSYVLSLGLSLFSIYNNQQLLYLSFLNLPSLNKMIAFIDVLITIVFIISIISILADILFLEDKSKVNKVPLEFSCNLYDYLTFSYINGLIDTAHYKKSEDWLPATIKKVRPNNRFDIVYEVGELEKHVPSSSIRQIRASSNNNSNSNSNLDDYDLQVGSQVLSNFRTVKKDDIPSLVDEDSAEIVWNAIEKKISSKSRGELGNEMYSSIFFNELFNLVFYQWLSQGFFNFLSSMCNVLTPLALEAIISSINSNQNSTSILSRLYPGITGSEALIILIFLMLMNAQFIQQNFMRGRHVGIVVRSAIVLALYEKIIKISNASPINAFPTESSQSSSKIPTPSDFSKLIDHYSKCFGCSEGEQPAKDTKDSSNSGLNIGRINNLLSVDLNFIFNISCYSHGFSCAIIELILICLVLFALLGHVAWVGVAITICFFAAGYTVSMKQGDYQSEIVKCKDLRMNIVNQFLNSYKIVKLFSLEKLVVEKVDRTRSEEIHMILWYTILGAVNSTIVNLLPILVTTITLLCQVYWLDKSHVITASEGFTTLLLFKLLQGPMWMTTSMFTDFQKFNISKARISEFLDDKELPSKAFPETVSKISSSALSANSSLSDMAEPILIKIDRLCFDWEASPSFDQLSSGKLIEKTNSNSLEDEDEEDRSRDAARWIYRTAGISKYEPITTEESQHGFNDRSSIDDDNVGVELVSLDKNSQRPPLLRSNSLINIAKGELVLIIGGTGCGKTTLLSLLLGECQAQSGSISIDNSRLNFSAQKPWIQNSTVRENILFGSQFDEGRYAEVCNACCLDEDFKQLAYGDETEIGEKGINLSGGQQMRVDLARSVYNCGENSHIILLDDPLSAVDQKVKNVLFNQLVRDFLKDKTRLLVTHELSNTLKYADKILYIVNSSPKILDNIIFCTPEELVLKLKSDQDFFNLNSGFNSNILSCIEASTPSNSLDNTPVTSRSNSNNDHQSNLSNSSVSAGTISDPSTTSGKIEAQQLVEEESKHTGDTSYRVYIYYLNAMGGVMSGFILIFCSVAAAACWAWQNYSLGVWMNSLKYLNSPSDEEPGNSNSSPSKKLNFRLIFALFIGSSILVVLLQLLKNILQGVYGLKAAKSIHTMLTKSVLMANMFFFESTPQGRITNRFSGDIAAIDQEMMGSFMFFNDNVLNTLQALSLISLSIPWLIIILTPLIVFFWFLSKKYISISTEMKSFENNMKSFVFIIFSESARGIQTIRNNASFNNVVPFDDKVNIKLVPSSKSKKVNESSIRSSKTPYFNGRYNENCNRFICKLFLHLDDYNKSHLYLWHSNRWLNYRMQIIGTFMVAIVGAATLYIFNSDSNFSDSYRVTAGLALIYCLDFTNILRDLCRAHADVQNNLISVERIEEYSSLVPEKYLPTTNTSIDSDTRSTFNESNSDIVNAIVPAKREVPRNWPHSGKIEFNRIKMKYKSSESYVLGGNSETSTGLSFIIPSKKKVGVVGRTGAGKSSLISTLFRLTDCENGSILIDGVDIARLSLMTLRSSLSIVPQEPILTGASIRENIDPFNEYTDTLIWETLKKVQLKDYFESTGKSALNINNAMNELSDIDNNMTKVANNILDLPLVSDNASNLSVGQRQLFCLARILIRVYAGRSSGQVIVLDECTANIDIETDKAIQDIIKNELKNSTILTIAHRLLTIIKYDLIVVLEKGELKEFGSPFWLLSYDSSSRNSSSNRVNDWIRSGHFKSICKETDDFKNLLALAKENESE